MSSLFIQKVDGIARHVVSTWDRLNDDRYEWLKLGKDARAFLFQKDTNDTSVGQTLPWKNKTSVPKLTQISDNLNAQYMKGLIPNETWFRWKGRTEEDQQKASIIQQYFSTKLNTPQFRLELSKIVRDWVTYGNCFAGVEWVHETAPSLVTGEEITTFVGPRIFRISPLDCVIEPTAPSFDDSIFIRRVWMPISKVLKHNETTSGVKYDEAALENMKNLRSYSDRHSNDFAQAVKDHGLQVDGFNTIGDYLDCQYVELLEFWGDVYVNETGEILENQVVTVADRMFTLRSTNNATPNGKKPFGHAAWRLRPDNLYGMGPLDNLVGMQYRIDHLENLKADVYDLIAHPIEVFKGDNIKASPYGPGAQVFLSEGEEYTLLRPDANTLTADSQIREYQSLMEFFAGSPRETMGFRTEGEKTAYEIQQLRAGAATMFKDKLHNIENTLIEPLLNQMFSLLISNLSSPDLVTLIDEDTGIPIASEITAEDIKADGSIYPVGSRYFEARNKAVQEITNFWSTVGQDETIKQHIDSFKLADILVEELGEPYRSIVSEFAGINEQAKAMVYAALAQQQAQEELEQMGVNTNSDQAPQQQQEQQTAGSGTTQ